MKTSPARALAFSILERVDATNAHADELLQSEAMSRLSAADRNLATALVMETLRWQLLLDQRIRAALSKPNQKLDRAVRTALRLGTVQLLVMTRIPAHAAIAESVELTKSSGHRYSSGLVNAVLRKIASAPANALENAAAHPQWMVERWRAAYGAERAALISTANQQQPVAYVRAVGIEAGVLEPGEFLTAAWRAGRAASADLRRMDEGSQLVAELLEPGDAFLDCCAAPGGKTLVLAERNPRATIAACDLSAARLEAMKQRVSAIAPQIHFLQADASELVVRENFDRILCDVPCSGTGTLARNPEIRHRLAPEEFARQAERQQRILATAFRALAPGGRLVYSTCSLEPEENEQVLERLLADEPAAELLPVEDRLRAMEREGILREGAAARLIADSVAECCLRTLPGVVPCDGFFAAILTKRAIS